MVTHICEICMNTVQGPVLAARITHALPLSTASIMARRVEFWCHTPPLLSSVSAATALQCAMRLGGLHKGATPLNASQGLVSLLEPLSCEGKTVVDQDSPKFFLSVALKVVTGESLYAPHL